MPAALRRAQILERIQRDGGVSVADLARAYGVSTITVHRDLERLTREGLVERVHGGARAISNGPPIATAWAARVAQARAAKAAIADHAVRAIEESSTIFLDSSSTCLALARRLMEDPPNGVTVVTNSPAIAYEMLAPEIHVVVTPGELDQHMRMLAGRWTIDFISELHFAVAFVSAAGLTLEAGLTTSRRTLADVINAARANTDRTIHLIDSTKFGRASLLSIAPVAELDVIVTDDGIGAETAAAYKAAGVRLEIATTRGSD